MDRKISRKRSPLRLALILVLGALALWGISTLLSDLSVSRLRVQSERLMISTVDSGLVAGSPAATRLARSAFFQSTGGQWVYVIDESGEEAVRRPIRLGRQSPEHLEVLSGLKLGERVITSSYETFGDAQELILE